MKRVLLPVLSLALILICLNGCAKKKDISTATPTNKPLVDVTPTANTTPTKAPTIAPEVTALPTANKLVYMIEDFNTITDPVIAMKPVDLAMFGIISPELKLDNGYAEEGNAFSVVLTPSTWCQLFQIDDTSRISVFKENAKSEYYLRMYVANLSQCSMSCTIKLSDGLLMSFIDANKVILTDSQGVVVENETSNATAAAGEDSAITVPANFIGWVAWPLTDESLKAWEGAAEKFSNLSSITSISFDIRPVSPLGNDFYVFDNLCIANTPS